ncbi:MAG: UvrB/UvrC motif-containing protein [Opitutales bacterium]
MTEKLQCSICGKEATVHLTQIVNNKIQKVDLCESCAHEKGVTEPGGFSLADLMSQSTVKTDNAGHNELVCPECGHTNADFNRTGRLGCAVCYTTFESLVRPVLEDIHAGTQHKGKVPDITLRRQSGEAELKRLQDALQNAVKEEAYEEAAKFRDRIKRLESNEEQVEAEQQ